MSSLHTAWKPLTFALVVLVSACAQEIRITEGVADYQVLQRGPDQTADFIFAGSVATRKDNGKQIEARLLAGSTVLGKFDWVPIATVKKQTWSGQLQAVPVGGPYRLELRVQGGATGFAVDHVLVGDLWILAGQSNMEGHGDLVDVQSPIPQVHTFDMADRWLLAEEPLHTTVSAVDRVHWRVGENSVPERWSGEKLDRYLSERRKGAGLGLPFAVEMYQRTGIPVGLIPCAHGGTSMDQWSPALKDRGGDSLYGAMLRRFHAVGGSVRGILWYQGESDANPQAEPEFLHKFEDFVKGVREDFNAQLLPFYYVQIGRHVSDTNITAWNRVQAEQLRAESDLRHIWMAASVDSTMDDPIHVSTGSLKVLARRLANLVCIDQFPRVKNFGALKRGPRPLEAKYENGLVRVRFSGVNRNLESEGRISGFTIHDAKGVPVPLIYKAAIDPAEASTVLLYVGNRPPQNSTVQYGFGKDPYCNVHDAENMAVPAFGPVAIQEK